MTYSPTVAASQTVQTTGSNTTGSTLTQLTPVRVNTDGSMGPVNVSVEADIQAIAGIVAADIANGTVGNVASSGRVLNIGNTYPYGTQLYISKTGGVTSTQPSIGVGGFVADDFVVSLGIVAQNSANPANYDLIVRILLVGEL